MVFFIESSKSHCHGVLRDRSWNWWTVLSGVLLHWMLAVFTEFGMSNTRNFLPAYIHVMINDLLVVQGKSSNFYASDQGFGSWTREVCVPGPPQPDAGEEMVCLPCNNLCGLGICSRSSNGGFHPVIVQDHTVAMVSSMKSLPSGCFQIDNILVTK